MIAGWPAAVAVLTVAGATGFSLRAELAETPWMWVGLLGPYLLLSALGIHYLRKEGVLAQVFRVRSGDVSLGILLGLVMVAAGLLLIRQGFPPGSPQQAWLFSIYAQVGNLNQIQAVLWLLLVACAAEVVWRGWIARWLAKRVGERAALPLGAVLYALAHVPTVFTLAVPGVGLNPLLVLAAFGAGLCFGFAARVWGRLPLVIVAHSVFSYFLASPPPAWLP